MDLADVCACFSRSIAGNRMNFQTAFEVVIRNIFN